MKAEHRKELETNTLADKMGNVMQRVKTGRRGTFFLYVAAGVILVVGVWFWYVNYIGGKQESSDRWVRLDDGGPKGLFELAKGYGDTPVGKAAQLQLAWNDYWEFGLKRLGAEPKDAMLRINLAGDRYKTLITLCADDPVFEPQALLGFAVVQETKALQDQASLDQAIQAYQVVVSKHKDSAEGKFAEDRLKQLQDKDQRKEISAIYDELRKGLQVPAVLAPGPFDRLEPEKKKVAAPKP